MHCRSFLHLSALILVALPAIADAQPGSQGPGLNGSEYHAVAPLPQVMPSPMPSLPPPVSLQPGEVPNTPFPHSDRPFSVIANGFVADIERDGRIRFSDKRSGAGLLVDPVQGPLAYFSFDITDMVMDWIGDDPYLPMKLAIMDQTRPARIRRKANHEQRLMDNALGDLPVYLQAVWSHGAWTHEQRRQILFELWDEAAESGNELIRRGGIHARVTISHFIATRIEAGSRHAFTAAELKRMNRERSASVAFQPYSGDKALNYIASADDMAGEVAINRRSLLMTRAF